MLVGVYGNMVLFYSYFGNFFNDVLVIIIFVVVFEKVLGYFSEGGGYVL